MLALLGDKDTQVVASALNFSDLSRALTYARSHGQSGLALENGTQAFNANALPLGI